MTESPLSSFRFFLGSERDGVDSCLEMILDIQVVMLMVVCARSFSLLLGRFKTRQRGTCLHDDAGCGCGSAREQANHMGCFVSCPRSFFRVPCRMDLEGMRKG